MLTMCGLWSTFIGEVWRGPLDNVVRGFRDTPNLGRMERM